VTQSTSVRSFNPSEWPIYKALRLRALEESPNAFGSTLALEIERPDTAWNERLKNAASSGQDCVFLAEFEGTPSGLVWAKADPNELSTVHILPMWVAPNARGRGIGDKLLRAAILWAKQYGASFVKLGATCGNTPAIRLYQRAGFVEIGATEPIHSGSALLAQNMVLALAKSAV
jgi:ribosomal protein S18 acetylase RimI-like enzyme